MRIPYRFLENKNYGKEALRILNNHIDLDAFIPSKKMSFSRYLIPSRDRAASRRRQGYEAKKTE